MLNAQNRVFFVLAFIRGKRQSERVQLVNLSWVSKKTIQPSHLINFYGAPKICHSIWHSYLAVGLYVVSLRWFYFWISAWLASQNRCIHFIVGTHSLAHVNCKIYECHCTSQANMKCQQKEMSITFLTNAINDFLLLHFFFERK